MVVKNGDFDHQVDLNNPDLTIVVEIIKVHPLLHYNTISSVPDQYNFPPISDTSLVQDTVIGPIEKYTYLSLK